MMMRCLMTLLLGSMAFAAVGQFQGTVIDQTTRQPIVDGHVAIVNSSLGTVTDKNGKFAFGNLAFDSVTLRVSAIGYLTQEYVLTRERELVVELIPSAILLHQAVTITAQRSERMSFDVNQSASAIAAAQLSERSPRSTPEALMNETGVWIQKTNHGGGSPIIRGLVGNQVLLVVDGIRLNNATYRYGPNQYLSTIDPGIIDRIEVNRGSGSVLYGSDALGGVLQVISATPSFSSAGLKIGGRLRSRWMSAGMEQSIRPEIEGRGKRVAFLGGFSARNFGDVLAGGNLGVLTPTAYRERSGDAKLLWRLGSRGILTSAFQHTTQNHVPRYDQVTQGGFSLFEFEPQTRQLSYLRWESSTPSPWVQSFRLTVSMNRSKEGTISQKNNSVEMKRQLDEVNTLGLMAEFLSNPSAHWQVQSGIEYYSDRVSSTAHVLNTVTNTETAQRGSYADGSGISNLAVFTNHQWDWKNFQISAGARFNRISVSVTDNLFGDQQINPNAWVGNVGVMYKLNSRLRMVGTLNTGFRAPNVDDMSKFGTIEANIFEIPSGLLSPERSLNMETGLKYNSTKLSWNVTAYQSTLTDLIDRVATSYQGSPTFEGRTVYQKRNVGEAIIKGIEADVDAVVIKSLTVYGNVTYTYGENKTRKEPMRRIPPLFGRLGLRYGHPSGLWIRTEWAVAGKQDRLAGGDRSDARINIRLINGVMPGWDIVNLHAGYSYRFWSIQLSAQNIFDEAYRVYASGIDGYGRSMTAAVNIRF